MRKGRTGRQSWSRALGGLLILGALGATGCQSTYNGQTLMSGYYQQDDIQYYRPGPEFKLAKEAAAMQTYAEERSFQAP